MNNCSPQPEIPPPNQPKSSATYHCGTITYTKKGLIMLIGWLLWGDLCYTLMQDIVPSIVPLKLNSLGASSSFIALMMSTLPGIFNTTVCPWISFKSDRHRGPLGRRRPFIIYTMPFLVLSLLFIGFSDQIGGILHSWFFAGGTITKSMVIIGVLAVFLAMFELFNMFVASLYMCLFNDVVPKQFIGTFLAWFRLIGVLTSAGYQYFIFKYALSHMTEIYTYVALLYLLGYGAMCYKVKEGDYPPPEDDGEPPSLKKDIRVFIKNCFTIPYYWDVFLHTTFTAIAGSIAVFIVFFNQSVGLDLGLIGKMNAINQIILASSLVFAGVLVDRFNPVRTEAYLIGSGLVQYIFFSIWILATPPPATVYFWVMIGITAIGALSTAMGQAANLPRLMTMFPIDQFGQFCGAQAMVRSAGVMLGGLLAGLYLDFVKDFFPEGDLRPYRYLYLWILVFGLIGAVFHYRAYRCWKRLGAERGTAPTAYFRYKDLPTSTNSRIDKKLFMIPMSGFAGYITASIFLTCYFYFISKNIYNFYIFGFLSVALTVILISYYHFVRFMERP